MRQRDAARHHLARQPVRCLREGLARYEREPADEQVRDGLIQRFEYTYELCHRTLKRFIQRTAASPEEVDRMAFQDLIRTANQQGLLLGRTLPLFRRKPL